MNTPGRNDPCPCGSGKKFKQCCGRPDRRTPDEAYNRLRRMEGEASDELGRIAEERYGKEGFLAAMAEFRPDKPDLMSKDDPDVDLFMRWFEYDWLPEQGDSPAEILLEEKDPRIDPDILRLVERTIDTPYSFFQVTGVRAGASFDARDIFRKREFTITERGATHTLQPGHILYARVVEWEGVHFMMGNGSQIIPADFLGGFVDMREELVRETGSSGDALSDDALMMYEEDLRLTYFDTVEARKRNARDMRNTDGDPLLFHTIRYEVPSFARAFKALRGLAPDETDAELMRAEDGKNGPAGETAVIHWSKRKKGGAKDESIVQAVIRIQGNELTAEANSAKRAARVRKEIEKRLGKDAVHLRTEIDSMEGAKKNVRQDERREDPAKRAEEQARLLALPEVQAHLKKMMEQHWATWPDTPVPALRGMTPRQAAHDPAGRELLESLLLDFESKNRRAPGGFERVDVAKLRKELGIEKP